MDVGVLYEPLDDRNSLDKLNIIAQLSFQRKFLDVAITTEIAEWVRGTTAPYCKIYYRWKETYDAFYKLLMGHI